MSSIRIGLIGDRDDAVKAHRAIPLVLAQASRAVDRPVDPVWLATADLARDPSTARRCHALWSVPATPYTDGAAAIAAIRWARESGVPFLGTCGGYQHALLEFARHVLGLTGATTVEEHPGAELTLIGRLSCDLVEARGRIRLDPGSRLAAICGTLELEETYHCRFGFDPRHRERFAGSALRIVGEDQAGEPRAFEVSGHPFFVGTAFQPERTGLEGRTHPIVTAFVRAALEAHAVAPRG
jgi:CTP synthase (UTP-ammonia lyase)